MFNILLFIGCFAKQSIKYTTIGVVDSVEGGILLSKVYFGTIHQPQSMSIQKIARRVI